MMITTINKPKRVTRQTASVIDHIIINSIMHTGFKSGTIKIDISNRFPTFFCYKHIAENEDAKTEFISKRFFDQSIGIFEIRLRDINWSKVRQCRNAMEAYINFFNITDSLYDECFPVAKMRLKQKKASPLGLQEVSKSPPKESRNYTKNF